MKNMKKLLVLVLALVMCISAISISAFAADFDTGVYLNTRYFVDGKDTYLYVNITTEKASGGLKATLEYPSAKLTFVEAKSKFVEDEATADKYSLGTDALTFVVLTNDLSAGSTYWADLCFKVVGEGDIALKLKDIQVCDVNENLDNAVTVADLNKTVDEVINGLGAQFRPADSEKNSAIRFGTKVDRVAKVDDKNLLHTVITIDGTEYYAVKAGHLLSYTDKLTGGLTLDATVDATGKLIHDEGIVDAQSSVNYKTTDEYIIFTVAIGFKDNETETAADKQKKNISARPYVVYKSVTTGEYAVRFGQTLVNSYNKVENMYSLVTDKAYE